MGGNSVCGILANVRQPGQRNFYMYVMYTHIYTVDLFLFVCNSAKTVRVHLPAICTLRL